MANKLVKGQVVHVVVDPRGNNGDDVAPAMITNVKEVEGEEVVNLRVFLDTGADARFTNIKVLDERPEENDDDVDTDASGTQRVAFWPTRS